MFQACWIKARKSRRISCEALRRSRRDALPIFRLMMSPVVSWSDIVVTTFPGALLPARPSPLSAAERKSRNGFQHRLADNLQLGHASRLNRTDLGLLPVGCRNEVHR